MNRLTATYWLETDFPLEKAIAIMAGEQSTGTFVKIPGESQELMDKYAARVESIELIQVVDSYSLHNGKRTNGPIQQAMVRLSWPFENIGYNLSILLATVAGNLFELAPFSGLKLLTIDFPESFKEHYPGPKFSIAGTYKQIGIKDRPVIGTIIKPSVGLDPETTAQQVSTLIEGGLDFIKDDELMSSSTYNVFEKRVDACMKVINNYAQKTGKKPMYAFNISGTTSEMLKRHDYVLGKGGTCIMVNLLWAGLSSIEEVSLHSQLPIHGHRNGWGIFSRNPAVGIAYSAMSKIWRMAGVDHLHTNGLRNKFCESDESVIKSIKACQTPIWAGSDRAMPVVSSGQWAGQAFDTYKAVGNPELMYLCGGGIMGHPDGIKAGIDSVKQAWQAAIDGLSIEEARQQYQAVDKAFKYFG
ncbi:ribulose-bisphosphate carboxylase large subunit family protein [Aquiflexum sp.]|uniref:ribulose-bisphosphate carboxylase large subunit family protein n=1 Tax=Aquiflexum sp. TaxID=1872584 RepID=UPI003593EE43